MQPAAETCRKCKGAGTVGKAKDPCPKCKGTGQFVKGAAEPTPEARE